MHEMRRRWLVNPLLTGDAAFAQRFLRQRNAFGCSARDTAVASPAFTAGDAMPVSDLDINRSAHLWIQQHGDQALAKAREMVEAMRRKGDEEGADTWLRIIAAITTLGPPPNDTQH
jgi:hypothetical protein